MWFKMPSKTRIFNPCCVSHHYLALSTNSLDLVSRNWGSCGWRPLFHEATGHDITIQASLCLGRHDWIIWPSISRRPCIQSTPSKTIATLLCSCLSRCLGLCLSYHSSPSRVANGYLSSMLITDTPQIPIESGIVFLT